MSISSLTGTQSTQNSDGAMWVASAMEKSSKRVMAITDLDEIRNVLDMALAKLSMCLFSLS